MKSLLIPIATINLSKFSSVFEYVSEISFKHTDSISHNAFYYHMKILLIKNDTYTLIIY